MIRTLLPALAIGLAAPAFAQDGALGDMTVVGSALSHKQMADRAAGGSSPRGSSDASTSRARANCAKLGQLRARFGAGDPRIQRLDRLCAQAGY